MPITVDRVILSSPIFITCLHVVLEVRVVAAGEWLGHQDAHVLPLKLPSLVPEVT
jgi:hypothetical protein